MKENKKLELVKQFSEKELATIIQKQTQRIESVYQPKATKKKFKVAIVSDTHLGSKVCKLEYLNDAYDIIEKEHIKTVLHGGDNFDGNGFVYKGHIYELSIIGFDNQLKFGVENYPKRKGVKTYMIAGNHCCSWKDADIVQAFAKERSDIVYLGQYLADVVLNGVKFRLIHPIKSSAYALTYFCQKELEAIPSGEKPQVYIRAHSHTAYSFFYRNIYAFGAGSFQGATDLTNRLGINVVNGFWILDIEVNDDELNSIKTLSSKFIPYYN